MNILTNRLPLAALLAIIIVMGVEVTAWQFGRESLVIKRMETRLSVWLGRPIVVPVADNRTVDRRYDDRNPFFNATRHADFHAVCRHSRRNRFGDLHAGLFRIP